MTNLHESNTRQIPNRPFRDFLKLVVVKASKKMEKKTEDRRGTLDLYVDHKPIQ